MSTVLIAAPGHAPQFRWKLLPQWDKNPKLVEQAATWEGKLAMLGVFGLLLFFSTLLWWWTLGLLIATSLLPARRRDLLTVGALGTVILGGSSKFEGLLELHRNQWQYLAALAGVFLFGVLLFKAGVTWPRSRFMRRPVVLLNVLFASLALIVTLAPMPDYLRPSVQLAVLILGGYIWFFAYSLQDRLAPGVGGLNQQVGTWAPFWTNAAGAGTPLCKGAAYLRRIEAKNPEELAVTQLKGLQLLIWCVLLKVIWAAGHLLAFGTTGWGLGIPGLDAAIASKQLPATYLCWASLVAGFADTMLDMAVWGNTIVACCRMAGFRALRNTYRPLESTSIADFWNRYYYYFKELLVDFFFYPTYTRYFKTNRKLRLFAATLAAATFGNMLYHFFRDIDLVWKYGPWEAIIGFRVYAFYTLLLGFGIGISQLRGNKPKTDGGFLRTRVQPAVAVLSFFCLVHIFDYTGRDHTITQHVRFLLHLFNL